MLYSACNSVNPDEDLRSMAPKSLAWKVLFKSLDTVLCHDDCVAISPFLYAMLIFLVRLAKIGVIAILAHGVCWCELAHHLNDIQNHIHLERLVVSAYVRPNQSLQLDVAVPGDIMMSGLVWSSNVFSDGPFRVVSETASWKDSKVVLFERVLWLSTQLAGLVRDGDRRWIWKDQMGNFHGHE